MFFAFAAISIKLLRKLNFRKMVPVIAYEVFERNIRTLIYMFRFAVCTEIDRNQMHSENFAKGQKRNQRMNLGFIFLQKNL